MKYAVVQCVNGNYSIVSEWNDEQSALVAFHDRCKILWNAPDVSVGTVAILDQGLNVYLGKIETITHVVEPEE